MSTEFESFVRPFQNNNVTPAQTYYQPGQIGVLPVKLNIGRQASGKIMNGAYSYSATFYVTKYENEKIYIGPDGQQGSSP